MAYDQGIPIERAKGNAVINDPFRFGPTFTPVRLPAAKSRHSKAFNKKLKAAQAAWYGASPAAKEVRREFAGFRPEGPARPRPMFSRHDRRRIGNQDGSRRALKRTKRRAKRAGVI